MSKVFFLKANGSEETEMKITSLPHPRHGKLARYINHGDNFYEINYFKKQDGKPCGWFAGNQILKDGGIYLCTPFDRSFTAIRYLLNNEKQYLNVSDLFPSDECNFFDNVRKDEFLEPICDHQEMGDDKYFRLNKEKLFKWLEVKTLKVKKEIVKQYSVRQNRIGDSLKDNGFNKATETIEEPETSPEIAKSDEKVEIDSKDAVKEEIKLVKLSDNQEKKFLVDASKYLVQYIPDGILEGYLTHLGLEMTDLKPKKRESMKRSNNTSDSTPAAKKKKVAPKKKAPAKKKIDTRGMKPIASFFAPSGKKKATKKTAKKSKTK
eukprot:TRINITY_DN773079_c0_g1_i1.p1 TRINITY_DN773079_c0_g1~~TRINITY_DN773079_c0_g1_i1.p1  ORF type:complete len:321 (-),score=90.72 TRINITY_DN773079_c0_g1_i1:166-1128(-)